MAEDDPTFSGNAKFDDEEVVTYEIEDAVLMLRPALGNLHLLHDIIRDPCSRLAYLPRDMLKACLIPYIPQINGITCPEVLKNRIKPAITPKLDEETDRWIIPEVPDTPYGELLIRCFEGFDSWSRHSHMISIELELFQCFIDNNHVYVTKDCQIISKRPNPRHSTEDWHYVGYNVFLHFGTFSSCTLDPEDPYREMHGYRITDEGDFIEVDYRPYVVNIIEIDILPCGLAYCVGFEPGQLDENGDEIDYIGDGCETWYKLMDFREYPPKSMYVEYTHGDDGPWDYIDDYGKVHTYPGSKGTNITPRSRSSQWNH